ncbi:LysE family translocator [Actibacterium pelagium]|nr:LysE family translocator [Actibacterium pelagium]
MEHITPFIAYIVALGIAAVIPGPGVAALVGQALGGNRRTSFVFLAGIALGDVVYLTVAVVGLAAVAQTFASAFMLIKLLGGAYLIYMALKFWFSDTGLSRVKAAKEQSDTAAFMSGFAITLGNPKTIVFYLALLPTVMDLNAVGIAEWAVLAVLTVLVLFVVLAPYVLLASKARAMMTQPKALRRLNRVAATAIGGAGAILVSEVAMSALRRT